MMKTVWQRNLNKTVETTAANGHVTQTKYSMFTRITWTDSKWSEDGMFEFSQVGTFPPFDCFVENPNPMRSKNEAQLFARKYLAICQKTGWVFNPNQLLEDWDNQTLRK
jgi:hypothetical protein